ncbi:MAG: hypothetical protein JST29_05530 [Bacteroidetes bacterium]|nr:hypothetical protein [Bacteroidota bacterium]
MNPTTKNILIVLAALTVVGLIIFFIYKYNKKNNAAVINNPKGLIIPANPNAATLKAANPTASNNDIAKLLAEILTKQTQPQQKGAGGTGFNGGSGGGSVGGGSSKPPAGKSSTNGNNSTSNNATNPNYWGGQFDENGLGQWTDDGYRYNKDGSEDRIDPFLGEGFYIETDKDGNETVYTSEGDVIDDDFIDHMYDYWGLDNPNNSASTSASFSGYDDPANNYSGFGGEDDWYW